MVVLVSYLIRSSEDYGMKYFRLISAFLVVSSIGCFRKTNVEGDRDNFRYSFSVDAIEKSSLSRPDAAEEIAKGAEQLFHAKKFSQADLVASDALRIDPSNFRAALIKAILLPLLLQKGILTRIQPLVERSPVLKKEWNKTVEKYRANPDYKLNSYYLDGVPDISTEKELQRFMDLLIEAIEKLRLFLRDNRKAEIIITSSPLIISDANERYAYRCKLIESANRSYDLVCPPSSSRHQVSLNRAEFESLQAEVAFLELYFILPNSYDLSGSVDSLSGISEITPSDTQKIADHIIAHIEFGSLRIPNSLSKARGWGLDIINSLIWANENQSVICKSGNEDRDNRPGFLFNKGICFFGSVVKELLDVSEKAVKTDNSPIDVPLKFFDDEKYGQIKMNIFAPYENPMESLKQLAPLKFNKCGKMVDLQDKTLAGVFPNGDVLTLIGNPECK